MIFLLLDGKKQEQRLGFICLITIVVNNKIKMLSFLFF